MQQALLLDVQLLGYLLLNAALATECTRLILDRIVFFLWSPLKARPI
jgi:hypothetical protein